MCRTVQRRADGVDFVLLLPLLHPACCHACPSISSADDACPPVSPLEQILLRKGGIREPTFVPAARTFLLFPTSFHTETQLLKPEARER